MNKELFFDDIIKTFKKFEVDDLKKKKKTLLKLRRACLLNNNPRDL